MADIPRRERSAFNQTNIGTVSRATLGRLLRDGGGARMGLSERYDAPLESTVAGCY